jgi:protein phosphatase
MFDVDFSELTQAGVRQTNEDAVGHWPEDGGFILAVADGLGDEDAGQLASSLALRMLGEDLRETTDLPAVKRLRRAVQAANVALYEKAFTVPELRHMGTTVTVTALAPDGLVTAHVGDCRLFLLRDRTFTQLTKDHTWAWAHLPGAPERVHGRPRRYSMPRCLGQELVVSVDVISMSLRAGDVLLQCSDGVHGVLGDGEMRELLESHPPEAACRALVRRARESASEDDASVQIASVRAVEAPAMRSWWRRIG